MYFLFSARFTFRCFFGLDSVQPNIFNDRKATTNGLSSFQSQGIWYVFLFLKTQNISPQMALDQTIVGALLLLFLLNDVLILLHLGILVLLVLRDHRHHHHHHHHHLVLLVLGDQVVHVGLRLRELHLVHPLTCVPWFQCFWCAVTICFLWWYLPVQERFSPEHHAKRIWHSANQALSNNSSGLLPLQIFLSVERQSWELKLSIIGNKTWIEVELPMKVPDIVRPWK